MVHDVRQHQFKDEPPEHAQRQPGEERATGGDEFVSLQRPEDETKYPSQHDEQEKARPVADRRVSNRDADQRKTGGNPFPGAPFVTKSNMVSTRLAKTPARNPLRKVYIVLLSLSRYTNQLAMRVSR